MKVELLFPLINLFFLFLQEMHINPVVIVTCSIILVLGYVCSLWQLLPTMNCHPSTVR